MKAKEYNARWVDGQTAAGRRVPALRRKYEAVLRANAKKTRVAYETVQGAAPPPENASKLLDENALKVSITARTAAERKRMASAVATPIVGKQKASFFEAPLATIASAQAEAATRAVRDALVKVISDSLAEGWTVPETADQIETTLTDYATWEAERLARTDLVGISNAISLESARTLGDQAPPFKRWLSAGDEKVRPTHRDANGQTVETDKTFSVGGFPMDHPGDFLAPYDETMNCRCTLIYLDTANASTAHSFEGGIVEDPIAEAVAASAWEEIDWALIAANPYHDEHGRFDFGGGGPSAEKPASASESAGANGAEELTRILAPGETGSSINTFWNPNGGAYMGPNGVEVPGTGAWEMKPKELWRQYSPDEPHIFQDSWPQHYVPWTEKYGKGVPAQLDTSPPNPKVGGISTAMKRWILGKGKEPFPWFREMRTEYARQEGLSLPQEISSSHLYGAPLAHEVEAATKSLREGIAKAPQSQPALWRGLGGESESNWGRMVAEAKPGDTINMLPASWSRDANNAMSYVGSKDGGVMVYAQPGSRGIADKAHILSDQEVVTAGEFDVVGKQQVEIPGGSPGAPRQKVTVVTVKQRHGTSALTAALLQEPVEFDDRQTAGMEETMPWKIEQRGAEFCVVKTTGETVHCHPSRDEANAQLRALYANEPTVAAAVDFTSGTMIALYPDDPEALEAPGGQPANDLHLTLCFLPNGVDGDRQTLIDLLSSVASLSPVLEGEVGGMGFFAPGPDGVPAIALPDVVGLNELRTAVAAAVEASGTTYATNHGFLPHITLLYVPEVTVTDGLDVVEAPVAETPDVVGVPLRFGRLTLREGVFGMTFDFRGGDTMGGVDAINAASFPAEVRRKLATEGVAMKDGSFPIRNRADLANAISSIGRASDPAAAKRHIVKRARALGAISDLPEKWGITAAGADLFLDEVDPWYLTAAAIPRPLSVEEPDEEVEQVPTDHAPVSGLVTEFESRHSGNGRQNHRAGAIVPPEYDSVRAAREFGLAATEGLVSAGAPLAPPDEWFEDPLLEAPTPLTVTEDGRVYGHLGEWGKCHTGIGGRCVMIPRSATGYSEFHNGGLELASGKQIRIGKLTLDTGHAPLQAGASRASAHYDHTGHVGAFVRAGEDQFGPWLAGAVKSDATPEQIRDLRANPPSGDWRKLAGRNGLELIAALAVPVQGFPVAALSASGEVTAFVSGWDDSSDLALVASGEIDEDEREWKILEARLDGIDGLAALVAANPYHDQVGRFDFGSGKVQKELAQQTPAGQYGGSGFKTGERVRTGEGHLGEVVGDSYSGSQVRVRRTMDGAVESHDPGTLTREGRRAALPPREPAITAAGVKITIEVDGDETAIVADASLDREIGLRMDFFRDHGYWPENPLAGGALTDAEFGSAIAASALMIEHPDAPSSVELRGRLVEKGLLV